MAVRPIKTTRINAKGNRVKVTIYEMKYSYRVSGVIKTEQKRFASKKEAENYEYNFKSGLKSDIDATFEEMMNLYFAANLTNANEETINDNKQLIKQYYESIKNKKVRLLKKRDYLDLWKHIESSNKSKARKNKAINKIKAISKFSSEFYDTPHNAVIMKMIPKDGTDTNKYTVVWTPDMFNNFIIHIKNYHVKAMFIFMFRTGARKGEAKALSKLNVKNSYVTLNDSIRRNEPNKQKRMKTKNSERTFPIDSYLQTVLEPLLKEKGKYVFGGHSVISNRTIDYWWDKGIKSSGNPKMRIHDLRDSFASWVLSTNSNALVALSKMLGHSDVNITLKHYAKLLPDGMDQVKKIWENIPISFDL